jgi:hypothetical protein
MPQQDFLANHHVVSGLYPVADAFASSATTDYVSLKDYRRATWFIHTGDATAGTANGVITVLAASDAAATGAGAIAFKSRTCASSSSVDTWGALTDRASTGFAMTAGDNYVYMVEVTADQVEAADPGNPFVALKVTEDTNDPIVASVICILSEPRYGVGTPVTAIA